MTLSIIMSLQLQSRKTSGEKCKATSITNTTDSKHTYGKSSSFAASCLGSNKSYPASLYISKYEICVEYSKLEFL